MPTWTLVHRDGLLEHVYADRIERDGSGWAWWTVVLVVNDPRWACMRRVNAADVIGEPLELERTVPQPDNDRRRTARAPSVGH